MGWKPFKITYTSDYFQELYGLAVKLIRSGHAYVDNQTPDEIKEYWEKKLNSPWRDRPISESLKLFEDLRRGLIEEGKATLRMKQDMQSENCNMYDLIAYRMYLSKIACSSFQLYLFSVLLLKCLLHYGNDGSSQDTNVTDYAKVLAISDGLELPSEVGHSLSKSPTTINKWILHPTNEGRSRILMDAEWPKDLFDLVHLIGSGYDDVGPPSDAFTFAL